MADGFQYDVFLSHSAKDKAVVRPLAGRLPMAVRKHVAVWFDEWEYPSPAGAGEGGRRPGEGRGAKADSIPTKIEEGLEHSRVLVLCMSSNAFGSDWAQLLTDPQPSTLNPQPTSAPLHKERRFIPLRLDDAPIKGSLAQFLYINWLPKDRKQEPDLYSRGLATICRDSCRLTERVYELQTKGLHN